MVEAVSWSLEPLTPDRDIHLRAEIVPALDEPRRRELWWWVRQRHVRDYPAVKPEPARDWPLIASFPLVDYVRSRSVTDQNADWLLAWYLYVQVRPLEERERAVLSFPSSRVLAVHGLVPLPAWSGETALGRALPELGEP
ncbi:hypothetical protein SAMN05216266_1047 [Amycolatopsis marina]|uniref:Uncharacterized protein n=1 Tax=Amycolatopsis marina TaxID=490629 RepID=A0A1I0XU72_9PSEU|nr:hypothetical protein [Amycolatopsis marina]SFB04552.1 hypothetical protein SAMN05216266_1047 [Amycolatopsis marina]